MPPALLPWGEGVGPPGPPPHGHLQNCWPLERVPPFQEGALTTLEPIPPLFRRESIFPLGSDGKHQTYNAGDAGFIPGLGRAPGEGNGNPLQYSCLENPGQRSHGQRSLVGYSLWGLKDSDTTQRLIA